MDTKRRLARRVREVRLERGLTQAEVGRALGLHRPTISEIEAGRRSITGEELVELSELLSVPVSELLASAGDHSDHPDRSDRRDRPKAPGTEIDETILEMARVIAGRFDPERVLLFGSHARGTAGPDSDVDLLVVMEVDGTRRRTGARIGAALHDFRVPKDIVVTTPDAFHSRRDVPGTIEHQAALEGMVLHARG